ncbi:MAG: ABC transporter substrate-binding protein [Pseudomonadota bacterium]
MLLPLSMLIAASTWGADAQAEDELNVLFLNPGFETGFWGSVSDTMRAAAEDLRINLEIMDADRDRIRMLDQAQTAIGRETLPDYVVVVNELQQGPQLAQMFEDAGIPYLFLLNRLSDEQLDALQSNGGLDHYLGSISPRNFDTGYMTARALIEATRAERPEGEIRVLALLGDTATPAAVEREAGMRQAVSEYPGVEIARAFSVDWLFDRAKSAVALFLARESTDIIWTASGPIAFGAMEAVREANLEPGRDIRFAGVGWFPNALDAVAEETMTMTYGGYFISGAWSMVMLRDIHEGVGMEDGGEVEAPLTGVDQSNIGDFQTYVRNVEWGVVDFASFLRTNTQAPTYDFSVDALFREIVAGEG